MIKLFSVKEKQKKDAASASKGIKQSAGELRLQKDLSELDLGPGNTISFPEGRDKILDFLVTLHPTGGPYKGGAFIFSFSISPGYPHDPPKVRCKTKIFHPNIDLDGAVCLNTLREDWKPVLNINQVVMGLNFLLMDPNPDDPLNKDAARSLTSDRSAFTARMQSIVRSGGYMDNTYFPPCRPGSRDY